MQTQLSGGIPLLGRFGQPFLSWLLAGVLGVALGAISLIISPLLALGLVVVAAIGLYLLPRPKVMMYLLVMAIPLTSGMPRGDLIPMFVPNEIVLVLTAGILFLSLGIWQRRRVFPGTVLLATGILIFGTMLIPLLIYYVREYPMSFNTIFSFVAPLQFLFLLWVFSHVPDNEEERHRVVQLMLLMSSIVALVALLQAVRFPGIQEFLATFYSGGGGHARAAETYSRVTSLMGAWNTLGTYLMVNLLLVVSMQSYKRSRLYAINTWSAAGLSLAGLLASGSFASIGGLVFGYIIIKMFDPRGLKTAVYALLLGAVALIPLWPIVSNRIEYQFRTGELLPETFAYRLGVWTEIYIPLLLDEPLWGVSPTTENVRFAWAESHYIYLWFRTGLISLISHLLWVFLLLGWLYKVIRSQADELTRSIAMTSFSLLTVLSVMAFTNEVFTFSGVVDNLWIFLGLIINSRRDWWLPEPVQPLTHPIEQPGRLGAMVNSRSGNR